MKDDVAEDADRESLLEALDALDLGVALFDGAGRLLRANVLFRKFVGTARARRGTTLAAVEARLHALTSSGPPSFARGRSRVEGSRPVVLQARRQLLPRGGTLVCVKDTAAGIDIDRRRTEMFATVAHELRTPMASIHGYSELLLKHDYGQAARREMLEVIYRQSTAMVDLVNELLDLARIEAQTESDIQRQTVDVCAVVRDVCVELEAVGGTFHFAASPGRVTVAADPPKFRLALVNVLSNAVKYSPEGTVVDVSVQRGRDMVDIVIADRGPGMTPEQIARIFDRFYRVNPEGPVRGTGLGMVFVHEIMRLHQGSVRVSARAGGGLEVRLGLPAGNSLAGASGAAD